MNPQTSKSNREWLKRKAAFFPRERKEKKETVSLSKKISNRRNARIAIREAALRGTTCVLLYCRFTDRTVKRYEVIPTEWEYRRDRFGKIRKSLWVQDCHEGRDRRQIKLFYFSGVIKAVVTDRIRKPKWPILIH